MKYRRVFFNGKCSYLLVSSNMASYKEEMRLRREPASERIKKHGNLIHA